MNNVTSPHVVWIRLYRQCTYYRYTHIHSTYNCLEVLLPVFKKEMLAVSSEDTEQRGWVRRGATNLESKLVLLLWSMLVLRIRVPWHAPTYKLGGK